MVGIPLMVVDIRYQPVLDVYHELRANLLRYSNHLEQRVEDIPLKEAGIPFLRTCSFFFVPRV